MTRRDPSLPPARKCTAKSSRTGKACRAYAILGGTVCVAHGGAAGQVKAKAAETLAQWRARRALDLDRGLDPILTEDGGKRVAALVAKRPELLPKLLELGDQFRGGGRKHEVTGADGQPLTLRVLAFDAAKYPKPKREDDDA